MNSTVERERGSASALTPYPAYRESGDSWLGEVPAHWEVLRLKSWLGINERVLSEDTDPDYTFAYLDIGSVDTGRLTGRPGRIRFSDSPSRARRVVSSGDTIVSTVRTYLKAVWHAEGPAAHLVASTGFAVLTPRPGTRPRFVSYVCRSDPFTDRVTAESVGIAYPAIAESMLGTFKVCVPPLPEQAAIVRFLDHADRRIRRYIHAKEKLIALLEEQKQAVVREAVTGRIDVRTGRPYPEYRDSGVEWLERMPAHWGRRRLKGVVRPVDRRSVDGKETLLSLRRDHGVVVYAEHFSHPPQSSSLVGFKLVEAGQLVVNRLQANNGLVFCSALDGVVSPDYSVFEMKYPIQMRFLSEILRTSMVRAHFWRRSTGLGTGSAGFLRLYDDQFLATSVPVPPPTEQTAILEFVDRSLAVAESTGARSRREMESLKEYRSRLIADVVTGKLDVREAAAELPEGVRLAAEENPDHDAGWERKGWGDSVRERDSVADASVAEQSEAGARDD